MAGEDILAALELSFTYAGFTAVGNQTWVAFVDSACQVAESCEANNMITEPLYVGYTVYFPILIK